MINLKIDPEFQSQIPPLTDDEFKQLEENILKEGKLLSPLIVWNNTLVDGHNRYTIAYQHPLDEDSKLFAFDYWTLLFPNKLLKELFAHLPTVLYSHVPLIAANIPNNLAASKIPSTNAIRPVLNQHCLSNPVFANFPLSTRLKWSEIQTLHCLRNQSSATSFESVDFSILNYHLHKLLESAVSNFPDLKIEMHRLFSLPLMCL